MGLDSVWLAAGTFLAIPLLWGVFSLLALKRKPTYRLGLAFIMGCAIVPCAALIQVLLFDWNAPQSALEELFPPFLEEVLKYSLLLLFVRIYHTTALREALTTAVFIALGFAAVEGVYYLLEYTDQLFYRAAVTPNLHILASGIAAFGVLTRKTLVSLSLLTLAIFVHYLFNFFVAFTTISMGYTLLLLLALPAFVLALRLSERRGLTV